MGSYFVLLHRWQHMQRDDFATKIFEIAPKFSYLVAKLPLDFFANFKPCTWPPLWCIAKCQDHFSQFPLILSTLLGVNALTTTQSLAKLPKTRGIPVETSLGIKPTQQDSGEQIWGRAGMAYSRLHSPPTNVARVWFRTTFLNSNLIALKTTFTRVELPG